MIARGSKYDPLHKFLKSTDSNRLAMTFLEIEEVLRFSLPVSASKYMAWWDGASQHTQAYSWTNAGFKAKPILSEKKVEFVKYEAE
ncbi:DUF7662 domain-containing protein [Aneurinibacillus migulanus]|uniref:DUF7662 domain-containing protein n=1 Tax=Aneurinibacillus migulanus TaxID=47500 RepID=A0A0D1XKM1_ANEMI|nr:hypothetical protein [Aneurinibacillus migulanus]KIV54791.1 hypothetical protein TS65_18170 [Aneurinibacillus migulanus]KON96638.1 hypothetical protein AF333_15305 [Aneurinibacillus migulanus]MED0896704.1 hypothetical protein [Aneurinibacillus migulanus]MED1619831.1 hypothetical protein [Aneurinibacillus migulanus]SDJ51557.1 hypothetical protein SAMN04487909_11993 [Aneurinibacillus migulanus]